MRKHFLLYSLSFIALAITFFSACRKENGIDNNTIIRTPYALYVGSEAGALLKTNDGDTFKTVFPPEGYTMRAILTSDTNLLFIKGNVHLSEDDGRHFNPTYLFASPEATWQPMILRVADHGRIYLSSISAKGIAYSENNGKKWLNDGNWGVDVAGTGITSFAQLKNGVLFAHSASKDSLYRRDNKDAAWQHVQITKIFTSAGRTYISNLKDTLLATDATGANGVHFSNDSGKTWTQFTGLPAMPLNATAAAFDVLFVGADSMGIYKLVNGTFVPKHGGLEQKTSVYAIKAKEDAYKNGVMRRYIYIATSTGVYRSNDMGENWDRVLEGSFRTLY